ncbi:unnamed protein product [marine sediment metagenome]|uniref:Uncharacterized protein n=1 Tax=marine sediment metagenome TaxID=412755 RepID=X1J1L8_9ZZZZ
MKKVTYPLNIDEELWNKFKDLVPRTKKLNDALVELIKDEVLASEK